MEAEDTKTAPAEKKPPKPIKKHDPVSEQFMEALRAAAKCSPTVSIETIHDVERCEYCKRKYMTSEWYNNLDDEDCDCGGDCKEHRDILPNLEALGITAVLDHGDNYTIEIDRTKWVAGCDCNGMRRIEDWLVFNVGWILDFYARRARHMQEQAMLANKQLRDAAGIHTKPKEAISVVGHSRDMSQITDEDENGVPF